MASPRPRGTFTQVTDDGQLAGYFLLDSDARRRAMACRGARLQLGYAVQLGTIRFLGTFLDNPEDALAEVMEYVADQLGHPASVLAGYGTERTRWDHQNAIKDLHGRGCPVWSSDGLRASHSLHDLFYAQPDFITVRFRLHRCRTVPGSTAREQGRPLSS
ncbi:DUF4158 domain-containing protein [Streptomyces sp. NPDC004237]|uniref:DUF4158 domain-containing protein n=1 Tax=Streptomyces sp. NPDC004237 TaxID=3154455 RepID=UPI0033A1095F